MKVYVVVAETDEMSELDYQIIGIYKNEDEATEKVADIMQEIEAYIETFPVQDEYESDLVHEIKCIAWKDNYPHKMPISDAEIDTVYVKEFDLL